MSEWSDDTKCPKCKTEMIDTNERFMSNPPIRVYKCDKCDDYYKVSGFYFIKKR